MHSHYIIEKASNSFFGKGIRYFLHFRNNNCINIEFYPFTKSFSIEFEIQDDFEHAIDFNFCLPLLFSFYISLDTMYFSKKEWFKKLIGYKGGNRIIGIRMFEWILWLEFWLGEDNCGTLGKKWRGYEGNFNISNFFLGKIKYSKLECNNGRIRIFVPEGYSYKEKWYIANWKKELFIRKRSRWFTDSNYRYEIEVEEGIPFPGKGTCSYNCEEDAMYSSSGVYKTEFEAANGFVKSVMNNRKNYPL